MECVHSDFLIAPQGGQVLSRLGHIEEARTAFERGMAVARQQGNMHAAEEMQGMMDSL